MFFLATGYAAAFTVAGIMTQRNPMFKVPGGLLITIAVCMTPLAVYGFQRWFGIWGFDDPGHYQDFYRWVRGGWFAMEIATVIIGLVAVYYFRFPFLTAPIAFVLWYISMDLTPIIAGGQDQFDWALRKQVSLWFGLAMIMCSFIVDRVAKKDYAFWGYLFGLLAFWGGLSLMKSDNEVAKFFYFLTNLGLIVLSVYLRRYAFIIFGTIGVWGYVGHLAFQIFKGSLLFPFSLTLLGLSLVLFGILLKKYKDRIEDAVVNLLPDWLLKMRPIIRA